mgnify:CR=1 FL=1
MELTELAVTKAIVHLNKAAALLRTSGSTDWAADINKTSQAIQLEHKQLFEASRKEHKTDIVRFKNA